MNIDLLSAIKTSAPTLSKTPVAKDGVDFASLFAGMDLSAEPETEAEPKVVDVLPMAQEDAISEDDLPDPLPEFGADVSEDLPQMDVGQDWSAGLFEDGVDTHLPTAPVGPVDAESDTKQADLHPKQPLEQPSYVPVRLNTTDRPEVPVEKPVMEVPVQSPLEQKETAVGTREALVRQVQPTGDQPSARRQLPEEVSVSSTSSLPKQIVRDEAAPLRMDVTEDAQAQMVSKVSPDQGFAVRQAGTDRTGEGIQVGGKANRVIDKKQGEQRATLAKPDGSALSEVQSEPAMVKPSRAEAGAMRPAVPLASGTLPIDLPDQPAKAHDLTREVLPQEGPKVLSRQDSTAPQPIVRAVERSAVPEVSKVSSKTVVEKPIAQDAASSESKLPKAVGVTSVEEPLNRAQPPLKPTATSHRKLDAVMLNDLRASVRAVSQPVVRTPMVQRVGTPEPMTPATPLPTPTPTSAGKPSTAPKMPTQTNAENRLEPLTELRGQVQETRITKLPTETAPTSREAAKGPLSVPAHESIEQPAPTVPVTVASRPSHASAQNDPGLHTKADLAGGDQVVRRANVDSPSVASLSSKAPRIKENFFRQNRTEAEILPKPVPQSPPQVEHRPSSAAPVELAPKADMRRPKEKLTMAEEPRSTIREAARPVSFNNSQPYRTDPSPVVHKTTGPIVATVDPIETSKALSDEQAFSPEASQTHSDRAPVPRQQALADAPLIRDVPPPSAPIAGAEPQAVPSNSESTSNPIEAAIFDPKSEPILDTTKTSHVPNIQRPETAARVVEQVLQATKTLPDGAVEITLMPEELGRVRLQVTAAEQTVTLSITAERPETLDLLRRHIDQLAQEYRSLGFADMAFNFSTNTGGGEQASDESSPSKTANGFGSDPTSNDPESQPRQKSTSDGLDIRI